MRSSANASRSGSKCNGRRAAHICCCRPGRERSMVRSGRYLNDGIPVSSATMLVSTCAQRLKTPHFLMLSTFGRVGAVIKMRVEDYYTQGRRGWVRLQEKGGKRHEMPCNHNLEAYLDAYISAAGLAGDLKGYLFRSTRGRNG